MEQNLISCINYTTVSCLTLHEPEAGHGGLANNMIYALGQLALSIPLSILHFSKVTQYLIRKDGTGPNQLCSLYHHVLPQTP
jgi:hypothetical protein